MNYILSLKNASISLGTHPNELLPLKSKSNLEAHLKSVLCVCVNPLLYLVLYMCMYALSEALPVT